MRFEQTDLTGLLLREGECIQFNNNHAEMEAFGCDVDGDEVKIWHEGDFDMGWSEDVNPGDWVLKTGYLSVYPDRDFHKKFRLI